MALDARKEAAEGAVNGLLDEEAAICGADPYCYAMTASAAFEEIALLRGKGMRFEKICAAFAKAGLLPHDAKTHSMSQAFLREKRRREKTAAGAAKKPGTAETDQAAKFSRNPEPAAPDFGGEAAEKEKIRKMTGAVVDTGCGKIIKHADGSFEF
jgi:hypothetical protein